MSQNSGGTSQSAKRSDAKETTCWKCGLVCKNRQGLSVHQNKCLSNVVKGESFFRNERIDLNLLPRKTNSAPFKSKRKREAPDEEKDSEKILPPSQPLSSPSNNKTRTPSKSYAAAAASSISPMPHLQHPLEQR